MNVSCSFVKINFNNGFRFSKTKTVCMHKSPIPVVDETKCLGFIFDRRVSFVPHLKYVKKNGSKALNILNIGNTEWGAD